MATLLERFRDFLTVYPKEETMSDLAADTPTPPAPDAAAADPRDERIAALEAENASLREQLAGTTTSTTTSTSTTASTASAAGGGFDAEARYDELRAQGVSEADALEQAAYEERLYNDEHGKTNG